MLGVFSKRASLFLSTTYFVTIVANYEFLNKSSKTILWRHLMVNELQNCDNFQELKKIIILVIQCRIYIGCFCD